MFRRGFKRSGGFRRPRAETIWQRGTNFVTWTAAGAAPVAAQLGDPAILYSGTAAPAETDLRWTVRRIRLSVGYTATVGLTAGPTLMACVGVAFSDKSATAGFSPFLPDVASRQQDWLYLGALQFEPAAAANGIPVPGDTPPGGGGIHWIDIRAQRKTDLRQDPLFTLDIFRVDTGARPAAGTVIARIISSVLWSRTRR